MSELNRLIIITETTCRSIFSLSKGATAVRDLKQIANTIISSKRKMLNQVLSMRNMKTQLLMYSDDSNYPFIFRQWYKLINLNIPNHTT